MAFSDARRQSPEPQVRLHKDQAGPDTTAASAVSAFGELGGQVRLGAVEGKLEANLAQTGDIIAAVNHPDTITTTNPDGSSNTTGPDALIGDIDQSTDRFQRIASSLDQGKITQQRATLEAEVELRRSIASAPGFAQQLRKSAQDLLGFNPSGAALETLFLSGPDSNVISQADKDLAEAQAFHREGFASSVEDGLNQVIGARAVKAQEAKQNAMIAQARISAPRVAVVAGQQVQTRLNGLMLQAMQEIKLTDGVENIEKFRAGVLAAKEQVVNTIKQHMLSAKDVPYDQTAYDNVDKEATRIADANIALLDNQDILKVMERRRDLVQAAVDLEGVQIAPLLALMAPFGDKAVENALELMAQTGGDPRLMKELMARNPAYAFIGDVAMKAGDIVPSLLAIKQGSLAEAIAAGRIDGVTGRAVAKKNALDHTSGVGDPENFPEDINALSDLKLPNMVMSTAAQTTNSYAMADEGSRLIVTRDFKSGEQIQRSNVRDAITNTNWALGWDEQKSQFIIQDRQQRPESEFKKFVDSRPFNPSQFAGVQDLQEAKRLGIDTTPGPNVNPVGIATDALTALNDMMVPLLKDPRWASEFGIVDRNAWATDFIADVNQQTIEHELRDPGSDTSNTLDFGQQARLRQAMTIGNQVEIFNVLEEAGMGKFNEQATIGASLERTGEGDTFVDTETGQIIRLGPDGTVQSVVAASGRFPTKEELDAAGPEGVEFGAGAEPVNVIRSVAEEEGFDPQFLEALARAESPSLDPTQRTELKNEEGEIASTALGLFQMLEGTHADFGGGNRLDPKVQSRNAINLLRNIQGKHPDDVREQIIRWHDGQNSSGAPSEDAIELADRFEIELAKLRNGA